MSKLEMKTTTYRFLLDEPEYVKDKPWHDRGTWVHRVTLRVITVEDDEKPDTWLDVDTYGVASRKDGKPDKRETVGLCTVDYDWRQLKAKQIATEHKLTDVLPLLTK